MTQRTAPLRRLLPLAFIGLGVAGMLALVGVTGADGGWLSSWWRESNDQAAGEDLIAKAAPGPEWAGGPTLRAADTAKPHETHGPVTVTVADLQGGPVEGLRLLAVVTEPPQEDVSQASSEQEAFTDATGRARFADLPYDGRATVRARRRVFANEPALAQPVARGVPVLSDLPFHISMTLDAETEKGLAVNASRAQSQFKALRALQVEMADATHDGWAALATAVVHGPEVALTVDRGLPLKLEVREGGEGRLRPDARWQIRPRLVWAEDAFGATTLPLPRGKPASVTCRVETPRGFIARKDAVWSTTIHPLAQRLEAVYPLRPAIEVILLVPPEAMPYRTEDWEGSVTVAGVTLENPDMHVDAQGRLHVLGGAYIIGDRVEVSGTLAKRFQASGEGFIGGDSRDPVRVPLTLVEIAPSPDPPSEGTPDGVLEFHFTSGVGIRLVTQALSENPVIISLGNVDHVASGSPNRLGEPPAPEPPPPAPLNVRAVAWHGGPAAGALVRLGEQEVIADAQGRARFLAVPDGTVSIQLLGAGANTTIALEVGPRPRPEAVVTAQAGGTLEIEVVDTDGRALPYAHVEVSGPGTFPHMDCVDGVQRLDPYTDAAGHRTLHFVTPGPVTVRAYFGTRQAERELVLSDSTTETVRLELPVLKAAPPPVPAAPDESGT